MNIHIKHISSSLSRIIVTGLLLVSCNGLPTFTGGGGGKHSQETPEEIPFTVTLRPTDGIRTVNGTAREARMAVLVTTEDRENSYIMTYKVDGGEEYSVTGIFPNSEKNLTSGFNDLSEGIHEVTGTVTRKDGSGAVDVSSTVSVWKPGAPSLEAWVESFSGRRTYDGGVPYIYLGETVDFVVRFPEGESTAQIAISSQGGQLEGTGKTVPGEGNTLVASFKGAAAGRGTITVSGYNVEGYEWVEVFSLDVIDVPPTGAEMTIISLGVPLVGDFNMTKGSSYTVSVSPTPADIYCEGITLESSDPRVLYVTRGDGDNVWILSAAGVGIATLTISVLRDRVYTVSHKVSVQGTVDVSVKYDKGACSLSFYGDMASHADFDISAKAVWHGTASWTEASGSPENRITDTYTDNDLYGDRTVAFTSQVPGTFPVAVMDLSEDIKRVNETKMWVSWSRWENHGSSASWFIADYSYVTYSFVLDSITITVSVSGIDHPELVRLKKGSVEGSSAITLKLNNK